jgi:hypothetical protein
MFFANIQAKVAYSGAHFMHDAQLYLAAIFIISIFDFSLKSRKKHCPSVDSAKLF